jgi:hypothetical protein
VFFSIHAWFLFLGREKTQIEAIRLFRVYTTSKNGGVQREVSLNFAWSALNLRLRDHSAEHKFGPAGEKQRLASEAQSCPPLRFEPEALADAAYHSLRFANIGNPFFDLTTRR